jgi:hypothetical protein
MQELVRTALGAMQEAGVEATPHLVVEETLTLVSLTTARAAEVAFRDAPEVGRAASEALAGLPFAYREYLVGSAMLTQDDPSLADAAAQVLPRLERKQAFYTAHFPAGAFPGERALSDKMPLWMGRISPPGMPDDPTDRLHRLGCIQALLTHLRLVLGYARA